jgi:hypothetical protein
MCCDGSQLCVYQALWNPKPVLLGDARRVDIRGIGEVVFRLRITPTGIFVRNFELNLFSLNKGLGRNYELIFSPARCAIRCNGMDFPTATRSGNLFHIGSRPLMANVVKEDSCSGHFMPKNTSILPPRTLQTALGAQMLMLWHQRLGHLKLADVQRRSGMAQGINPPETDISGPPGACRACNKGKQHTVNNQKVPATRTEILLALVHSEGCGPRRTASIAGPKYYILFFNDYSRMTCVNLLRFKWHKKVDGV